MRLDKHTTPAAPAQPMPFDGLGFAMDTVRKAARVMTLRPHRHTGGADVVPANPVFVPQPSGYLLLVTLGREIRGR